MKGRCLNVVVVCAVVGTSVVALMAPRVAFGAPPVPVSMRVPVVGAEPVWVPDVDACVSRLDPQLDIGYERIAARCPDLMHQLDGGAWAPWLPRGWKESGNDLSAGSLKELRALVDREIGARESSRAATPDIRSLQPILTTLAGSRNETGWSRFKSWLRSILERHEQPADESWVARMVSQAGISQSLIRLITYGALAAVVVLAAVIVTNELRAAGFFPNRRGVARKRRERATTAVAGASWSDIEKAELRDRPRLLLELIVRRLSDRGFLPPSGALTVRELTRAARLSEADDRSRLGELALASERVRFSTAEIQPTTLDEPIARGRELLDRLDAGIDRLNAGSPG